MPREGITEDQVRQALELCKEKGEKPSHRKLRDMIGSGSYSTIRKHLKAIRESEPDEELLTNPPPSEFQQRIDELGKVAWDTAIALATAEIIEVKTTYHARTKAVESELSEALEEIEMLEEDIDSKETELSKAKKKLATLVDTVRRYEVLLNESNRREQEAVSRFEAYVAQLDKGFTSLSKVVVTGAKRNTTKSCKKDINTDQT